MSDPYLGEIKLFPYSQAPKGWVPCEGQVLPISGNQPLYSLFGTSFGGDGRTQFALPDLRDRVPIATGNNYVNGTADGEAEHTLTAPELPAHTHAVVADASPATGDGPSPAVRLAGSSPGAVYGPPQELTPMAESAVDSAGNDRAHDNMQPFLALAYFVCATGGQYPTAG